MLADTMSNYVTILSNGSATGYCMTAQEDNAIFESMVRAAMYGLMDFSKLPPKVMSSHLRHVINVE